MWEWIFSNLDWLFVGLAFLFTWLLTYFLTGKIRKEFDEALTASETIGAEIEEFFAVVKAAIEDNTLSEEEAKAIKDNAMDMIAAGKVAAEEWWDFVTEVYRKIIPD